MGSKVSFSQIHYFYLIRLLLVIAVFSHFHPLSVCVQKVLGSLHKLQFQNKYFDFQLLKSCLEKGSKQWFLKARGTDFFFFFKFVIR